VGDYYFNVNVNVNVNVSRPLVRFQSVTQAHTSVPIQPIIVQPMRRLTRRIARACFE
jgi:hypothetical protein